MEPEGTFHNGWGYVRDLLTGREGEELLQACQFPKQYLELGQTGRYAQPWLWINPPSCALNGNVPTGTGFALGESSSSCLRYSSHLPLVSNFYKHGHQRFWSDRAGRHSSEGEAVIWLLAWANWTLLPAKVLAWGYKSGRFTSHWVPWLEYDPDFILQRKAAG